MTYDVNLADRLREATANEPNMAEKAMFGGLTFMVAGHMALRATDQKDLLIRVGPDQASILSHTPQTSPFLMNGREIAGWLRVKIDATATDDEFDQWIEPALRYARSLPPKRRSRARS